ncbi:peptidyl-prolyl cis-trans isomerase [Bhargavaea ginsengi]|uniref:peptidyl-prolyl cis-trans isomerase n=1 Tax=Bhargavaea ginsengi TaxID=426757 RepID=UPI00203DC100|nr:peptidyl-prolyl cis-trans isomerase [Bhargavaea ginsengi]MCM3087297.1 peptidyl-prolyl cis-trans isomerase [Bhargavaea ginsengi]
MMIIIPIQGNCKYRISLDPTTWIFDDRKLDLKTYFVEEKAEKDTMGDYIKATSKHWSRELMEGAKTEEELGKPKKKFKKQELLNGTFGIVLEPFLKNAEPEADAETVVFTDREGGEHRFPIKDAYEMIFQFSKEGKPLGEEGPAFLIMPDGSNMEDPIKGIRSIAFV